MIELGIGINVEESTLGEMKDGVEVNDSDDLFKNCD